MGYDVLSLSICKTGRCCYIEHAESYEIGVQVCEQFCESLGTMSDRSSRSRLSRGFRFSRSQTTKDRRIPWRV